MQSLNRLGIILAFKINQDYITAAFCENKDKPVMHCNGKCVLAKKLKNAEQNEEKQRTENMERANVLFFCKLNRLELSESLYNIKAAAVNPFFLNGTLSSFSNDIFKPPQHVNI